MNTLAQDDLNDDLSDLIGSDVRPAPVTPPATYQPRDFTEPCAACRGTGMFRSWSGRGVGACFKCKGAGKRTFKSSPEQRTQSRASTAARKERNKAEAIADYRAANPDIAAWLDAETSFDFAASMRDALAKWGCLTDGQAAAVRKCIARNAERKVERAAREAAAPTVEINKLEEAFARAKATAVAKKARGIINLHLRLQAGEHSLSFRPGSEGSQWAGMIFVKSGEQKLGHIKGGKFVRRFECTAEQEAAVLDACGDPLKAALAYGQRWSECAVCGRTLLNDGSIERGIGPVCAEKYGWAS